MLTILDQLTEAAAKAISNIKFDKIIVWDNAQGAATAGFLQNLARSLPPMLQVLKEVGGVEVPEYLAKLAAETPSANGTPTPA